MSLLSSHLSASRSRPGGLWLMLTVCMPFTSGHAQFTDITDSAGVTLEHQTTQTVVDVANAIDNTVNHIPGLGNASHLFSTWLTGGVAAGDYDQDGWPDMFVIGGDAGESKLFRNLGNGSFADVTDSVGLNALSGRVAGAVFADYDGDGDLDLFLGGAVGQSPRLMNNDISNQNGFTDIFSVALPDYQVDASPNAWGGAFGDFNGDQCLDLLIPRSLLPDGPSPTFKTPQGSTQHLWQNQCDGSFIDASLSAQIAQLFDPDTFPVGGRDQTFAGNFTDFNNDGLTDIVFSGDIGTDLILVNQGNGQFINVVDRFIINDKNAMGIGVGDINNDGNIDFFTANIGMPNPGNRVFYGNGDGSFLNGSEGSGLKEGHWGWGSCLLDVNLDGYLDVFHVNGFYFASNTNPDSPNGRYDDTPAVLFMNNADGTFTESAASFGVANDDEGRGVSCFDFDRDGDTDIAISNHKGPFKLFRNDLPVANRRFLNVKLEGESPNTQGVGAKVYLQSENVAEPGQQLREIQAGNNFLSANLAEAHFGLGDRQGPFRVNVVWPNGFTSEIENLTSQQFIVVDAQEATILNNGFE